MDVFIHEDAHIASIALSLAGCQVEGNPIGELTQKELADVLKKENIRSYNYVHGKRQKLTSCYMGGAMELSIPELIRATHSLESQSCHRDDYAKSDMSKIVAAMYAYLPEVMDEYEDLSVAGVTVADALKTFATYDDGTGMKAWHWDEEWGNFEVSDKVHPGRVKPYPWLLRQLGTEPGPLMAYEKAEFTDPLILVKYLKECVSVPSSDTGKKVYSVLLKQHTLHIPDFY